MLTRQLDAIKELIDGYETNHEISGAALLIRKNDQIVFQNKWGYSDIQNKKELQYDSLFRMMSMSKCITGVLVMKLVEQGRLSLDDEISRYIQGFSHMRVSTDSRYLYSGEMKGMLWKLLTFRMDRIKTEASVRRITIRDFLSHASGLEQGVAGLLAMMKMKDVDMTLAERVNRYTSYVLDFQPGVTAGYSPLAGFDVLGRIIEIVSGESLEAFLQNEICNPLGMKDTTFFPSEDQKNRLVKLYKRKKKRLLDVTDSKEDIYGLLRQGKFRFESGAGGLFSTIIDYEIFARMLCNEGIHNGHQFLKPETVALIHTPAQDPRLEPEPGFSWGLSVKIRQNPEKGGSFARNGTYGWSGAFGTHFFISPKDKLEAVFVTNRSDWGGAGSPAFQKIEEVIFKAFGNSVPT